MTVHRYPTTNQVALDALRSCRRGLLEAVLDASASQTVLAGARAARARELTAMLDAAIAHCDRLVTVIEGDLRADQALAEAKRRHPAGRAR